VAERRIDAVETGGNQRAISVEISDILPAVPRREVTGDTMLPIIEGRIDRHEPTSGSQRLERVVEESRRELVIEMVKHSLGDDRVVRVCIHTHFTDTADEEFAAVAETFDSRADIISARVVSQVIDFRQVLKDIARSTTDIEHTIAILRPEILVHERRAHIRRTDRALRQTIDRRCRQHTPPTTRSLSHTHPFRFADQLLRVHCTGVTCTLIRYRHR
jgi:hypothetical protein